LPEISVRRTATYDSESAAVSLVKLARLLPAAVTAPIEAVEAEDLALWSSRHDLMLIDSGDVFQYERTASRSLTAVSEAPVPLADASESRIIAFRPADGGIEHLAILIGQPDPAEPVLARIHSECFTGDLLGSLRCDCGDQLRGAISEIAAAGAGVLLYLAQEGRGIGLVNKLRAYTLQDQGFDTIDANEQLGFDADERAFLPAAQILLKLGFSSVRLMTNNPDKVAGLAACGVTVAERVTHAFPSNKHNEQYLKTKVARSGHLF
ncbi:MAG: GTP cyclohydrolase II, partial [Magnetovibrio sp.]|nr:GTP cyclohydrolase II [Magnetovibrio sp.]